MRNYITVIRAAFGRLFQGTAGLYRTGRWWLAIAVIASLLVPILGPASPVRADPPDPAARLQVIIKKIVVNNDHDIYGSGDLRLTAELCFHIESDISCPGDNFMSATYNFDADSGDEVTPDYVMPRDGDRLTSGLPADAGVPVYPGMAYLLAIRIKEYGLIFDEELGRVAAGVDQTNGWGIGTWSQLSDARTEADNKIKYADYTIVYEIRRAPLPDLRMQALRVLNGNDGKLVCVTIDNIGELRSGPVPLTVRANGVVVSEVTSPALEVGQSTLECVKRTDLPPGQIRTEFIIDESRQIPEMDETNNNAYDVVSPITPGTGSTSTVDGPVAMPSPEPKPTMDKPEPNREKADLTVKAIKVNGQAPDGKNDCKPGQNDLTVVVKNGGKGDAGRFALRLTVDGDDLDTTVENVRAGEEREVAFDNVQLKKGQHTLKAVVDPEHALAEGNDDNNELKVSVRCQG